MNTIKCAFRVAAGVAIAALMVGLPLTGTQAAPYETPPTGFEPTQPIYTFPTTGYDTAHPVYTFPASGYETAKPVYTFPATEPVPSTVV